MLCFEQFGLKWSRKLKHELTEAAGEECTDRSSDVNSPSFASTGLLEETGSSASFASLIFSLNFTEFSKKKKKVQETRFDDPATAGVHLGFFWSCDCNTS